MALIEDIRTFHDDLTAWRRDIHAHPELGFEEQRTSDLVAEKLKDFGIEVPRAIGKFQIRAGAMMAGGAFFDIAITGKGAHGARPESGVDPVLVGSHITTALQSIVARNVRPVDTVVVSVTQIHGGEAYNVIPERAVLRGTVRCFSKASMNLVEERMRRIAEGVAGGFGATASLDFCALFPPLVNQADENHFIADSAAELVGEANVNRQG